MTITALPRTRVGMAALGVIAAILALDHVTVGVPDLFDAAPALALGSGQAPTGAHCTAQ